MIAPGIRLVSDEVGRAALCEAIAAAPRVALDTEFHAERRYLPELMLLQIATGPEDAWLLDPRAVDPAPVAEALADREVILHGGLFDLRLVAALGATPERIFDTQHAAGLVGLRYPERLSDLCARLLDRPVDKSSTLTDWSVRPLTDRQLRYAAEDVLLLFPLADRLVARLSEEGREDWVWALGAELREEAVSDAVPDLLLEWDICSRLEEDALKVIVALQAWRYAHARQQDKPPFYLLPDSMVLDLARRRPTTMARLAENRRLHTGLIKRHGRALLACIKAAQRAPLPGRPPTRQDRVAGRAIALWAELVGKEMRISPQLLVPEPIKIVRSGSAVLNGWRVNCRARLENFLTGQEMITFADRGGIPRLTNGSKFSST